MTSAQTDQLYAKWEEVEGRMYEEILDELDRADFYKPETIARRITDAVMHHLDGYNAEDILEASRAAS